jgi:hypothetical protein
VAASLQEMGQARAVGLLKKWGNSGMYEDQVVILCRMLFEKKEGGDFRRPMLGGASFLGDTSCDQWPAEPIAIHKGIPILITREYVLQGEPESSTAYLEYCLMNCQWSACQYAEQDAEGLKKIMADFVKTNDWKRALSAEDESFLRRQAEPRDAAASR